jgi:hypothetical protein
MYFEKIRQWDIVSYDIGDSPAEGVVLDRYPEDRLIRTDTDGVISPEIVTARREGGVELIRTSPEYIKYPSYRRLLEKSYGFPAWKQQALFT